MLRRATTMRQDGPRSGNLRQLAKQAVAGRTAPPTWAGAARMVSDHFLASLGRRSAVGAPSLPPAGGATKGIFA